MQASRRRRAAVAGAVALAAVLGPVLSACSGGTSSPVAGYPSLSAGPGSGAASATGADAAATAGTTPAPAVPTASTTEAPSSTASAGASATAGASSGPSSSAGVSPAAGSPAASATPSVAAASPGTLAALRGKVIVIDPGHNGGNGRAPSVINKQVFIGNGSKACDTTGTETNAGYTEAAFTWDTANRLATVLRAAGATVVLTRSSNTGVGPCITERAAIGNAQHADVALSIHADGGPAGGRGFHVIAPARVGANAPIVAPSLRLATTVRAAFAAETGEPFSTYTGGGAALTVRSDLGGLNLSRVPKIFIECGNMRNAADAARLTSAAWRQKAAQALADGIARYLAG